MIKSKLVRAMALGLCLSALFAVAVTANSNGSATTSNIGETNSKDNKLYEKQKEIDQYVFVDHVDEIVRKGFTVVYTGIGSNFVEVGISPYKKEYADYLYDIFGSNNVRIVEGEKGKLYEETETGSDLPVNNEEGEEISPEPAGGGTDAYVGGSSPGFAGYDHGSSDIVDNALEHPVVSSDSGNSAISPDTSVSYTPGANTSDSNADRSSDMDNEIAKDSDITDDNSNNDEEANVEDSPTTVTNTSNKELMEKGDITEDADVKLVSTTNNEDEAKKQGLPTIGIIFVIAGALLASVFMSRKQKDK
ncbi:MAG: hypothetical protein GX288_05735 [Clostridiales bacterium]|nr:hypothetical protein [Clostridiales bacterium]